MIIERVTKLLLGSVGVTDRSMDRMWVGFVNRAINASIWLAFIRPVKIKYQITDCKDKPHVQFGKKHNIFLIWNVNQHYPIEGIGYGSGELIKIGIHNCNYLWIFPDIKYTKVFGRTFIIIEEGSKTGWAPSVPFPMPGNDKLWPYLKCRGARYMIRASSFQNADVGQGGRGAGRAPGHGTGPLAIVTAARTTNSKLFGNHQAILPS